MQINALSVTESIQPFGSRIRQPSSFRWKGPFFVVATANPVWIRVMKQDVFGSLR